jgi:hypothetical protein
MKKFYEAPEMEELLVETEALMIESDPDTDNPVVIIDNPSDDDLGEW